MMILGFNKSAAGLVVMEAMAFIASCVNETNLKEPNRRKKSLDVGWLGGAFNKSAAGFAGHRGDGLYNFLL